MFDGQKALGRVEVHVRPGRDPDELAGFGVADMAAGADYLGERAEASEINPLAFPEAAGNLCYIQTPAARPTKTAS